MYRTSRDRPAVLPTLVCLLDLSHWWCWRSRYVAAHLIRLSTTLPLREVDKRMQSARSLHRAPRVVFLFTKSISAELVRTQFLDIIQTNITVSTWGLSWDIHDIPLWRSSCLLYRYLFLIPYSCWSVIPRIRGLWLAKCIDVVVVAVLLLLQPETSHFLWNADPGDVYGAFSLITIITII